MPGLTRGVIPALVTPLTPDGDIDTAGCARLIDHVVDAGVDGVLALGSTGEAATLGHARRYAAQAAFVDALRARVPLAVGVAESGLVATIGQVRRAVDGGADAVVVAPPSYAPIDDDALVRFYEQVSAESSVPVLAYNIPSFTKVRLDPVVLEPLFRSGAVAGIKDSGGDLEYLQRVLAVARSCDRDVRVFTGMDTLLLPSLVLGADGAIAASSNLAPELSVSLTRAFAKGDWAEATALQERLTRLVFALRCGPLPTGIKAALSMAGICGETPAAPLAALAGPHRHLLEQRLSELGAFSASASQRQLT